MFVQRVLTDPYHARYVMTKAKSAVALSSTASAANGSNGAAAASAAESSGFWKRALLLIGCSLGIYATFLLYGILQERMYDTRHGIASALLQCMSVLFVC